MGFPFLTGFYSKDILLEYAYVNILFDSSYIYIRLHILTAFFTAIYSLKLIFFIFIYTQKSNLFNNIIYLNEINIYILISFDLYYHFYQYL